MANWAMFIQYYTRLRWLWLYLPFVAAWSTQYWVTIALYLLFVSATNYSWKHLYELQNYALKEKNLEEYKTAMNEIFTPKTP